MGPRTSRCCISTKVGAIGAVSLALVRRRTSCDGMESGCRQVFRGVADACRQVHPSVSKKKSRMVTCVGVRSQKKGQGLVAVQEACEHRCEEGSRAAQGPWDATRRQFHRVRPLGGANFFTSSLMSIVPCSKNGAPCFKCFKSFSTTK